MRSTRLVPLALGAALIAAPAPAQLRDTVSGPVLSMEEAVTLAGRNNPFYLQLANNRRTANAAVRSAYGNLLPSVDAQVSGQYRKSGSQAFQGLQFSSRSDVYQSSYWLGLTYQLNTATLLTPRVETANRDAVEAEITGSGETLRALVKQDYLSALQAEATASLQDTLVRNAEAQLELARARAAVGSGTRLDVTRAEVALGTLRVAAIRAHNAAEVAKLRLFERMGVAQPANVRLTTTLAIQPPPLSLTQVVDMAKQENPTLHSLRSREKVAALNVRRSQGSYLPTLTLSTGWGGYTYEYANAEFPVEQARQGVVSARADCFSRDSIRTRVNLSSIAAECQLYALTSSQEEQIRRENAQFPFNFTKQPMSLTATVSLPIFNGFTREYQVQEAQAARDDARYEVRARELQLTADVTAAYLTLTAASQAISVQEQNAAKAREELRLTEERYRVGAATFIEISDSRANYEQAQKDLINAIYDYHKAFAALESAVGRPLR